MDFQLKALTDVWTGGPDGKSDELRHTGIKGSIRWWYEALIRGFGSYACDPRSEVGCVFQAPKKYDKSSLKAEAKRSICPACYFFGCTGWSSKVLFRIETINAGNRMIKTSPITANDNFSLSLVKSKSLDPAERDLVQMALKVIIDYGALGGKTTFKPSEISAKNTKLHHRDFGIIARASSSNIRTEPIGGERIIPYLKGFSVKKQNQDAWPDLRNFWFVQRKHISRIEHNNLVDRDVTGAYSSPSEVSVFLGGFIAREKAPLAKAVKDVYADANAASKKIFSFHGNQPGDRIERCFGYARSSQELKSTIAKLLGYVSGFGAQDIMEGNKLMELL